MRNLCSVRKGFGNQNDKIYVTKPVHIDFKVLQRELDCLKDIMVTNSERFQNILNLLCLRTRKRETEIKVKV